MLLADIISTCTYSEGFVELYLLITNCILPFRLLILLSKSLQLLYWLTLKNRYCKLSIALCVFMARLGLSVYSPQYSRKPGHT